MKDTVSAVTAGLFAIVAVLGSATPRADAQEVEWEETTPYYEDDPWYDMTEWLDANDYNPTDELRARDDDEVYEASDDIGVDVDDDNNESTYDDEVYTEDVYDEELYGDDALYDGAYEEDFYGYEDYGYDDAYQEDDWYYDYYDEGYADYVDYEDNGFYDYSYRYYDYDNDSLYDAYTAYYDWDEDGVYEDSEYYAFNVAGVGLEQEAKQQQPASAQQQSVSGRVQAIKQVAVRNSQHTVVRIKRDGGDTVIADLGPANELYQYDLGLGDPISVRGPISKVGQARVLIAQWMKANGQTTQIDRNRQKYAGTVTSTKKTPIRGREHLIALVTTNRSGRQRIVDLGPANQLQIDLNQGDSVTVDAVPVKTRSRKLLLAQSLAHNGKTVMIDRSKPQQQQDANQQQQQQQQQTPQAQRQSSDAQPTGSQGQQRPPQSAR